MNGMQGLVLGVAVGGAVALTLVLLLSINRRRKKAREAADAREPVDAASPRSARPTASPPGVGVSASLATAMAQTAATTAPATIVEGQRDEVFAAAPHEEDGHFRVPPITGTEG